MKKSKKKKGKGRPVVHDIAKPNKSIPVALEELANVLFSVQAKPK